MPRLKILVGIALMLVGSLAYGLPHTQDFNVLYTALGGVVMATAGFVALRHTSLLIGRRTMSSALPAFSLSSAY